jgi:hypothetical protein
MGICEEETATCYVSKKIAAVNGCATQASSAGSEYTSPARIRKNSYKWNQILSSPAHYATGGCQPPSPVKDSTALILYFKPSGRLEQVLSKADCLANCVSSHRKGNIDYSSINNFGAEGVEETCLRQNKILSLTRLVAGKPVGKVTLPFLKMMMELTVVPATFCMGMVRMDLNLDTRLVVPSPPHLSTQ